MGITRTLGITYAGVTVGAGGSYILENIEIQKDRKSLSVEFSAIIVESSEAALYTAIETLEAAFRKRDQDLVLDRGTSSETYSHSDNSGLNMEPSIREVEGAFEGLSREFRCSVSLALPEDDASAVSGQEGLRNFSYSVTRNDANKREINVQGVYTALAGNGAVAQYNDQIETLSTTIKGDVDAAAEWELVDNKFQPDRKDKFCVWNRTYIENLAKQSISLSDEPEIKNVQLIASLVDDAPGDSDAGVAASRPKEVFVSYSCSIDKDVTTDLSGVFTTKIKPRMIEYAQEVGGSSIISVIEVDFKPNSGSNTIEADMRVIVYEGDSTISIDVVQSESETIGVEIEPVDDGQSVYAADLLPGRGQFIRRELINIVVLGTLTEARAKADQFLRIRVPDNSPGPGNGRVPGSGGAIDVSQYPSFGVSGGVFLPRIREEADAATKFIGLPPHQQQISAVSILITYQYFVQAAQSGSSPRGGSGGFGVSSGGFRVTTQARES